jgi:hypothetical protein
MHMTFWLGNQNVRDHMEGEEMGKRKFKDPKEAVCVWWQGPSHLTQKRLKWQANVNTELHICITVNTVTIS